MIGRRAFLSLAAGAAVSLARPALAESDPPPSDGLPLGNGPPFPVAEWRDFAEHFPRQVARRQRPMVIEGGSWRALVAAIRRAPRLPYAPELLRWEIRRDRGACAVRSLTVRAFLADEGFPLEALAPCAVWNGDVLHMVLCVVGVDRDGKPADYVIDSIGNVLAPWRVFPYRFEARYHSGLAWQRCG